MSSTHLGMASSAAEHDDLLLPVQSSGALLVPETELEKTYKVSQADIVSASGVGAASKSFGLSLLGGPFSFDYSRNGRHLVLGGRTNGHLATLDWKASRPMAEVHVNETTRAVRWLHDETFFAAAQRRYVYIYDGRQGMEVHQLRGHVEVTQMEFLPYHFLLATIGNPGWLKYHDTSTGQLVAELRTKLGGCDTMAANPHNAIVHLGHQNGTVTLWSPSLSQPHVKLLAHRGPVSSLSIDPSSAGRLLASTGLDGTVKVWDMRNDWKPLASWQLRKPPSSVAWSQKGLLAVGWGPHVSLYAGVGRQGSEKGAYMTQLFPGEEVRQVAFCPFEDVLGVGHTAGFSSILVPGAGEAHIDSLEADPYETSGRRREREVKGLLDKIPADLITLDPDFVGSVRDPEVKENPEKAEIRRQTEGKRREKPFRTLSRAERLEVQGRGGLDSDGEEADGEGKSRVAGQEDDAAVGQPKEVKEKKKMRGKNSSLKRLMRKKRKNVITPETVSASFRLFTPLPGLGLTSDGRSNASRKRSRPRSRNDGINILRGKKARSLARVRWLGSGSDGPLCAWLRRGLQFSQSRYLADRRRGATRREKEMHEAERGGQTIQR